MKTAVKPINNQELEANHPLARPSPFRYMPLSILVTLLLILFSSCNNSRLLKQAIQNQAYIYVQTTDGEILKAKPVEPLHREEVILANFAENWLKIAFSWHKVGKTSENYVKENGVNYPYAFYLASLAMKPGYREAFMELTKKKYRQEFLFSKYISGEYQSYVRTFERPIVEEVKSKDGEIIPGYWDIKIAATRTHAAGKAPIAHEIFNKIIRLRAVEPMEESEKIQKIWGDTELSRLLIEMQKKGLQVVEVTDY